VAAPRGERRIAPPLISCRRSDDRPGRHVADLVEEIADPVEGGHAKQLEQAEQERDRAEPECDAREPASHRRHPSQRC